MVMRAKLHVLDDACTPALSAPQAPSSMVRSSTSNFCK